MMKRMILAAALLALLCSQVAADAPMRKLDQKWTRGTGVQIADMVITDTTGNGKDDIVVGLKNNSVVVFNNMGGKINEFYLGNASRVGSIYSMALGDVDEDGVDDIIYGLGGAKEVRTYDPHDFVFDNEDYSVESKDKVLYRVQRYHGSIYVTKVDGTLIWKHFTADSVKAVSYIRSLMDGGFVLAGVGDLVIYTFNERTDEFIPGEYCEYETTEEEMSGWATKEDCQDPDNCCPTTKRCTDCTAKWDSSQEVCYIDYTEAVCGEDISKEKVGWHFVTYKEFNTSIMFLDRNGREQHEYGIYLRDNDSNEPIKKVPSGARIVHGGKATEKEAIMIEVDNTVTSLSAADVDHDGLNEIIAASNNGEFYVINISNFSTMHEAWKVYIGDEARVAISSNLDESEDLEVLSGNNAGTFVAADSKGKIIWKQRADDAITGVAITDVEGDDRMDVVMTSRDRQIYIIEYNGNILWRYNLKDPVYGVIVQDLDDNGLEDFVVHSFYNVTRLQTNEFYIKKFRADRMYDLAYDHFSGGDYTRASIYIDRAYQMYEEINDMDSLPKCKLLRARVDDDMTIIQKKDADRFYGLALNYYAINELDAALKNIDTAREIYTKIGDKGGIEKCNSLEAEIEDDIRKQKKLHADHLYTKAVSLSNFGNFTGAIDLSDESKIVYTENGFINETIKCDQLIIGIGDKHLNIADIALKSKNYERALTYATRAKEIYLHVENEGKAEEAAQMVALAQEGLNKGPVEDDIDPSMWYYMMTAVAVLVFLIILVRIRQRPQAPQSMAPPVEDLESIMQEDEFDDLEEEI